LIDGLLNRGKGKIAHDCQDDRSGDRAEKYAHCSSPWNTDIAEKLDCLVEALRFCETVGAVPLASVEINTTLQQVMHELCETSLQKGVTLRIVPTSIRIWSNATLLTSALRNLVRNAISAQTALPTTHSREPCFRRETRGHRGADPASAVQSGKIGQRKNPRRRSITNGDFI
jgi:hypothetical protein